MFATTKLTTAAVTLVIGLAVTGAAALAATPTADGTTATVAATEPGVMAATASEKDGGGLRAILDRLVAAGTITRAQADAILAAVKEAAQEKRGDRPAPEVVKRIFAGMMRLSVEYIGLPREAVAGQLKAGKSLGEIAEGRPGKSREGLIAHLETKLTALIDEALAAGKIGPERAEALKSHLEERVTKFVDHSFVRKPR